MEEKVYFTPGELVTLKKDIPNKPTMIVVRKEISLLKDRSSGENMLKGIKCRWFTADGILQEAVWNTKDLIKL
jgi:uncharacterized protein YodC (DUF2158 family)